MYSENEYLVSVEDACAALDCGKSTLYSLLRSGQLRGFRIAKKWKLPAASIQEFISEQTKNNTCAIMYRQQ